MTLHGTYAAQETAEYLGATPAPPDFASFWRARMAEADAAKLHWSVSKADFAAHSGACQYFVLRFTGARGEQIYAKYLRPSLPPDVSVPLVLQFHGYPGASRSWLEQASFAGMGYALIAMDCPGQGGYSHDAGGYAGATVSGHLIAGLDGDAKDMYYVRLFQTIRVLCRIVRVLPGVDLTRIYVNGGSQGGALALACAALNADFVRKASILYPFLSDFQKVWELGADEIAYEGLRYYTRWFDPAGQRTREIFTKLGYIDMIHLAPWIKIPVLFGTGLADTICPPIAQQAVFNRLQGPKKQLYFPGMGHEEIAAFDDAVLNFYAKEEAECLL